MSQAAAILAYVKAHPGATQREIRAAHPDMRNVGVPLRDLGKVGRVGYRLVQSFRAGQAMCRAYYAREHCPPGADLAPLTGREAKPAPRPKAPREPKPPKAHASKPQPHQAPQVKRRSDNALNATPKPAGEAIVPAGVKVTQGLTFPDTRFTVDKVAEPLFSTLGIGRYLSLDTSVQRAYRGRP